MQKTSSASTLASPSGSEFRASADNLDSSAEKRPRGRPRKRRAAAIAVDSDSSVSLVPEPGNDFFLTAAEKRRRKAAAERRLLAAKTKNVEQKKKEALEQLQSEKRLRMEVRFRQMLLGHFVLLCQSDTDLHSRESSLKRVPMLSSAFEPSDCMCRKFARICQEVTPPIQEGRTRL